MCLTRQKCGDTRPLGHHIMPSSRRPLRAADAARPRKGGARGRAPVGELAPSPHRTSPDARRGAAQLHDPARHPPLPPASSARQRAVAQHLRPSARNAKPQRNPAKPRPRGPRPQPTPGSPRPPSPPPRSASPPHPRNLAPPPRREHRRRDRGPGRSGGRAGPSRTDSPKPRALDGPNARRSFDGARETSSGSAVGAAPPRGRRRNRNRGRARAGLVRARGREYCTALASQSASHLVGRVRAPRGAETRVGRGATSRTETRPVFDGRGTRAESDGKHLGGDPVPAPRAP